MKRLGRALVVLVLLVWVAIGGAIALDQPAFPPLVPGGGALPGIAEWTDVPAVQRIEARDGAPLLYRAYPGQPDRIAVLVHGSTGTGLDMHKVAQALQAAGATAYTISLRGHGGSGQTVGDVSYVGQLDDDLADFLKALGLDKPGVKRTLVGYSAGGGFALRTASGRLGKAFDSYIVISPYVISYTDIRRRHLGPWANAATLRIAGLLALEEIGLDWFQDLPAARYAVDPHPDAKHTPGYSYRMLRSLHMGVDRERALGGITAPTVILASDADELSNIRRLGTAGNPHIELRQVGKLEHDEMVVSPQATAEIAAIWKKLNDGR